MRRIRTFCGGPQDAPVSSATQFFARIRRSYVYKLRGFYYIVKSRTRCYLISPHKYPSSSRALHRPTFHNKLMLLVAKLLIGTLSGGRLKMTMSQREKRQRSLVRGWKTNLSLPMMTDLPHNIMLSFSQYQIPLSRLSVGDPSVNQRVFSVVHHRWDALGVLGEAGELKMNGNFSFAIIRTFLYFYKPSEWVREREQGGEKISF